MAEERVQRRLAAILAADVVGYSRMVRTDEEGMEASLPSLIQFRLISNRGVIVNYRGFIQVC